MNIERDVPYGVEFTERRVMDWFYPDQPNGRGILWIHGGGWESGDKKQWNDPAEFFCAKGYTCASAEYRLIPTTDFSGLMKDVRLAASVFRSRADELGFRKDHVAAAGSSSGGHLVAMLATLDADDGLGMTSEIVDSDTRPNAAICYCPVLSLYDRGAVKAFSNDAAREMLGGEYVSATPLDRITGHEPPFLFLHGDIDAVVPVSHSTEMHRLLLEKKVDSRLVILPGAAHGFGYGVKTDHQQAALKHIELFFDRPSTFPPSDSYSNLP